MKITGPFAPLSTPRGELGLFRPVEILKGKADPQNLSTPRGELGLFRQSSGHPARGKLRGFQLPEGN